VGDADEDGSVNEDEENEPEEEKEDDFQIAWEVLETAKLFESKLEDKEGNVLAGQGPLKDTALNIRSLISVISSLYLKNLKVKVHDYEVTFLQFISYDLIQSLSISQSYDF
jgi:hypothetical protein